MLLRNVCCLIPIPDYLEGGVFHFLKLKRFRIYAEVDVGNFTRAEKWAAAIFSRVAT